MQLRSFNTGHAFALALLISALLILRQYTDYLINAYDYDFSWFAISAKILINYSLWAALFTVFLRIAGRLIRRLQRLGSWRMSARSKTSRLRYGSCCSAVEYQCHIGAGAARRPN